MGQKMICPVSIEESYRISKPIFNSVYNKFVEKYSDKKDDVDTIGYMHQMYSKEEGLIGELFSMWIKEHYGDNVYQNTVMLKPNITDKEGPEFQELYSIISDNIIDLYDDQIIATEQESNEGDDVTYDGNEESNSKDVNLKYNKEYFKNRLFSAINAEVSDKELIGIFNNARENTFTDFIKYVSENFDAAKKAGVVNLENDLNLNEQHFDIIPNIQTLQKLYYVWQFNRPENRTMLLQKDGKNKSKAKKFYVITNYDGKNIKLPNEQYMIVKPLIDLRTKRKLSPYAPVSFLDESKATLPYGSKIGEKTAYISLKDMVTMKRVKRGDRKGEWYAESAHGNYSESKLNDWLKIMLRQENLTMATIRGGNSGTVLLTYVDKFYYDIMFPPETIKSLLPKMPMSFKRRLSLDKPNNFMQDYRDYENFVLKKLQGEGVKKFADLVSDFNQLYDLQQKLSIVNFIKYLNKELELGNIDNKAMQFFKDNIKDLPVEDTINEVTKMNQSYLHMGEYLASIIARHEWLKAARGNKYALNENLENIFNRVRLSASEGLVDLDSGDRKVLIYDQNKVYYVDTDSGNKIDAQTAIEGMTDIDNDDGQFHATTDDINRIASNSGRRALLNYERDPKEVKTVSYVLEQNKELNEDGTQAEDNMGEYKSMLFIAEPNFQVVEKDTDKVILTTSKDVNGNVTITAGPATNIPGQSIDRFGSLNVLKTSQGTHNVVGTHNIVDIPASATRTIILPATKSKTDAALGGTWANSFNVNNSTFNSIRKLLNKEFKSIMDTSLNKLHKIRSNPDYARKLLRYQTKVRDDATTEVKKMYEMTGGKGIYHPMFWSIFSKSLYNTYVLDDGLKLKVTIDRSNPSKVSQGMSTSLIMKGDMKGRIAMKDGQPEGVIVGVGNTRYLAYLSDRYLQSVDEDTANKFRAFELEDKVTALNNFLPNNPDKLGIVRQPVQSPGGYIFRNVLSVDMDAGDVIIMHTEDVAKALIGDSDGDKASGIIWPNQNAVKELESLLKEPSAKTLMDISADLSVFEPIEKTSPASYTGFVDTMLSVVKNFNGMGIITNLKTVASVLELKVGDGIIELSDGTEIQVIKALDQVVMDYAPLKASIKDSDLPSFARIVNRDGSTYDGKGDKYMQTIAAHERLLLLNASTDNTKEHLITKKWNINMETIASVVFKRVDGKNFKGIQVKLLGNLLKFFNNSPTRNGLDKETRQNLTSENFYLRSKEMYNFLNMNEADKFVKVKSFIDSNAGKSKLSIKSMPISNEQTVEEMLISRPYEKFAQDTVRANESTTRKSWGEGFASPVEFSEVFQKNVNIHAINGFESTISDFKVDSLATKIRAYVEKNNLINENTRDALEAAQDFLNVFETEFRLALGRALKDRQGEEANNPTLKIYEYSEEMFNFIQQFKDPYNTLLEQHGEVFAIHVTWKMFTGIGQIRYTRLYYPSVFVHPATFKMFMESYETLHQAYNKDTGQDILSSEVSKETSKIRVKDDPFLNCR